MAFTFRRDPAERGIASIRQIRGSYIRDGRAGLVVGRLAPVGRGYDAKWCISLVVKRDVLPGWGWQRLAKEFDNEEQARKFVRSQEAVIRNRFQLYGLDGMC